MSTDICYGAIVARDDLLLLVQPAIGAPWGLPGGTLTAGEDVDLAMGYALAELGIAADDIGGAFVHTAYLDSAAPGDRKVVFNLYAVPDWDGELEAPIGANLAWFAIGDLAGVAMDPGVRSVVLSYSGVGDRLPEVPSSPAPAAASQDRAPRPGLDVLRTLSGAPDGETAAAGLQKRSGPLADDVIDFALGDVWTDHALDRKTRSLQVVAMLAALSGRPTQLRSHTNGALNHGATPDQLVQTLRMVAVYAGFPAALTAWETVRDVLESRGFPIPARFSEGDRL